jgi:hypothetical protein
MARPFCFVLMPLGKKTDAAGALIDFDAVHRGIIHKPIFDRLIRCEFADQATANANMFYELGVRHATRPADSWLTNIKNAPPPGAEK